MNDTQFLIAACLFGLFLLQNCVLVVGVIFYIIGASRDVQLTLTRFRSKSLSDAIGITQKEPLPTGIMRFTEDDWNKAEIKREGLRRIGMKRTEDDIHG